MNTSFLRCTAGLVFAWIHYFGAQACGADAYSNSIGDVPPAVKPEAWLQKPAESSADWEALRGKVVVLEFWAIGCGPCVAEIPHLNELAEKLKNQPVQFIAVCFDPEADLRPFLKEHPINAWLAVDPKRAVHELYDVHSWPRTVIVDAEGRVAAITDPSELSEELLLHCVAGKSLEGIRSTADLGAVPGQLKIGRRPVFQVLIRPPSRSEPMEMWSGSGLTLQSGQVQQAILRVFNIAPSHLIVRTKLPVEKFDFYIKLPEHNPVLLESIFDGALRATFGVTARRETNEIDVFELRQRSNEQPKLSAPTDDGTDSGTFDLGELRKKRANTGFVCEGLEWALGQPVFDQTSLRDHFDFRLKWNQRDLSHPNPEGVSNAVREQLNLDLVKVRRKAEVVVIEAADAKASDKASLR